MASKTSASDEAAPAGDDPVIDMAELGQRLARRKAELGLPDLPRNSGKNRTASKRALLAEIAKLGGEW
jgi:hypothetical protein